jgi:hypothetical protein
MEGGFEKMVKIENDRIEVGQRPTGLVRNASVFLQNTE